MKSHNFLVTEYDTALRSLSDLQNFKLFLSDGLFEHDFNQKFGSSADSWERRCSQREVNFTAKLDSEMDCKTKMFAEECAASGLRYQDAFCSVFKEHIHLLQDIQNSCGRAFCSKDYWNFLVAYNRSIRNVLRHVRHRRER